MESTSDRPILHVASSVEIGGEIVRILGLPKNLIEFTLHFKSGEPVEVTAMAVVGEVEGEEILAPLKKLRFELREIEAGHEDSSPYAGTDIDRRAPAGEG
jgi:hypothetical protein